MSPPLTGRFPLSSPDDEPVANGDGHLMEDGEEAVATEPISKEEAAERLLVGRS